MRKITKIIIILMLSAIVVLLILLFLGIIIYSYNHQQELADKEGSRNDPIENGTIRICFSRQENCTARLLPILQNAASIKAALYDLDEKAISAVLKEKNADIVIDEDNYNGFGKKIVKPGLMHNKFFIVYNSSGQDYIITGSTNPTINDLNKNDNNMEIITLSGSYLMSNFEQEFLEIKKGLPSTKTRYERIIFNGEELDNYFCPDDGCEDKVLTELKNAKRSIYFMAFSFTSEPIGNCLVSKKDDLDIRGVFDSGQSKTDGKYSEYGKMVDAGLRVALDGNKAKLHHKAFIIDNETVITGSYNPTSSGNTRNDENVLVIHDKAVAAGFLKEFERVASLAGLD